MWPDFKQAEIALCRDGWTRFTSYWFHKPAGAGNIWVELEWRGDMLWPVEVGEDDLDLDDANFCAANI